MYIYKVLAKCFERCELYGYIADKCAALARRGDDATNSNRYSRSRKLHTRRDDGNEAAEDCGQTGGIDRNVYGS